MPDRRVNRLAQLAMLASALALAPAGGARTPPGEAAAAPPVILLHGLNRTSRSMDDLAAAFAARGRRVVNLDYPGARFPIDALAAGLGRRVDRCCADAAAIDFVTHSLGGIVVRALHRQRPRLAIRRVVMLAPPNQGSEVVDALRHSALFKLVTGPAGQQLGTGPDGVPARLGPVRFELGVIAGNRSVNPVFSCIVPGEDDGTVAVARARVDGMADFVVVPGSHSFLMHDDAAIRRALEFIEEGRFRR